MNRHLAVAGALALVLAPSSTRPAQAGANETIDAWNERAITLLATQLKKGPGAAFVDMALVHAAMYDAVNAIHGAPYAPYAPYAPDAAAQETDPRASVAAASAQAAHDVLAALAPGHAGALHDALTLDLAAVPEGAAKSAGIAAGADAARAVLALRAHDGRNADVPFAPGTAPGAWQPTPPQYLAAMTPWLAEVTPFVLRRPSQFRPGPPPALDSRAYARGYDEVRLRGAKSGATRDEGETGTARFWAEHAAVQYCRYFRRLAAAHDLAPLERTRFYALLHMAAADALITVWDAKMHYAFWRPVHAIPRAAEDGNAATRADAAWEPLLTTPNHPEYPSAHSVLTGAIVVVLADWFGSDDVASALDSTVTNTTHEYQRFTDIAREVGEARITGGLHFRFSTERGLATGVRVGRYVAAHALRPRNVVPE